MEKDHACPSCDGRKTVCGFVIDPGTSRMRISSEAPCPQCRGEGMVTEEQQEWIRVGKQCRQERLSRLEFASEAARRLDISIEQLMAAEMGRISPHILLVESAAEAKSST
ncbi:hypothetical protein A9R05_44420 (plasmid) [Burkholderia sp. KK1]|uniref:Uncharacterized protein n=1 Tax=Burkholderia sp. M701 TaxID=326454 RepID=V5YPA6_9BURK|nr:MULTISPECIES: hypothetical protein [Burkholderia]AQH05996.1 hypothetical protein A9R05_44420 [Burkholderia sp. KK1]BAO19232.1 hypothetical protein [Burkholderia sp. M701]